jgi:hypothetical protein
MSTGIRLDREEYVEQAYFFRVIRERLTENRSTQEILEHVHQEILATTRLPFAIEFLVGELKHSGQLSSGFARLPHYFSPFQTFVIQGTENERMRFSLDTGLLVLEREALYRAQEGPCMGLFIYQLEAISRNRLGYHQGINSMAGDPAYDAGWKEFLRSLPQQLDIFDVAEVIYSRSETHVADKRREDAGYAPALPALFGMKEGRIARANRGRDPLYLFAALQRQLGYPEVPRPVPRDDPASRLAALQEKVRQMEMRLRLLEGEVKGQVDLNQFGKPELLDDANFPGEDE